MEQYKWYKAQSITIITIKALRVSSPDPSKGGEPEGSADGKPYVPKDKWGKPIPNPAAEPMRRYMLKLGYEKGKDPKFTKGWCERQGVNGEKKKFNDYTVAELKKLSEIFLSISF